MEKTIHWGLATNPDPEHFVGFPTIARPSTVAEAIAICGKLSRPSKMPGRSYSIPAINCVTGTILRAQPGTTCSKCYARRGHYNYPAVTNAMRTRFISLRHPYWVEAVCILIRNSDCRHFRWHDSGDLQGMWHLVNIIDVAEALPEVKFWLPTRESGILRKVSRDIPPNLVIRLSATMIDGPPPLYPTTSGVVTDINMASCKAHETEGKCGLCRKCWDPTVPHVSYPLH